MYKIICFLITSIIFVSCTKNLKDNSRCFEGHLQDSVLQNKILKYIEENNLDPSKYYIMVSFGFNNMIYIENGKHKLTNKSVLPGFYEFLGDHLILYYSDLDYYISKDLVKDELNQIFLERKINLDSGLSLYHPATWRIEHYKDEYIIHKNSWPKYRLRKIPWGYELLRDSVKLDSFYIRKRTDL